MTATPSRDPSVSCLMVTRDRPAFAARAIAGFAAQRYPARELVIVSQGSADYHRFLRETLAEHEVADARVLEADPDLLLGPLRNLSLDAADGDLVCVWDDDDCSHPLRLRTQVDALVAQGSHTSFFGEHLQLFADGSLYWIDWEIGTPPASYRMLPGTMLMTHDRRFRYPETGPQAQRTEDWALMIELHRAVPVSYLRGRGEMYVYVHHGANTFPDAHHLKIRTRRARSCAAVLEQEQVVREAVAHYAVPRPIRVCGAEGPAYCIES